MKVIAVYLGFSSNLLIVVLGTCVTKIIEEELFSMNNSETQQGLLISVCGWVVELLFAKVQIS